jgi:hypothetical protein
MHPSQLIYPASALEAVWSTAETWREAAGPDESLFIYMVSIPPHFEPAIVVAPFFNGPGAVAKEKFAPFYALNPIQDSTREMPYPEVNGLANSMTLIQHGGRKVVRGSACSSIDPAIFRPIFDEYIKFVKEHPDAAYSGTMLELHKCDKIMEVADTATAFGHRGKLYQFLIICRWNDSDLDDPVRNFTLA